MSTFSISQSDRSAINLNNQEKAKLLNGMINYLSNRTNEQTKQPVLQVSLSYEPIKSTQSNMNQTLYQYNIPGNKFRNKSKNSNLVSKLQQFEKMQSAKNQAEIKKLNQKNAQSHSSSEEADEVGNNIKNQDNFRYFKDNIICFKCNKIGHYRAVCPQIQTCLFCFSEQHDTDNCPQKKVCYRCFEFGHIIANCPAKQSNHKCPECEKYHDGDCNFLISKIRDLTKKKQYYESIYRDSNLRCPRCLKYGHLSCKP